MGGGHWQGVDQDDGTPWRPIVHVEDITRAFVAALRAPREAIHAQAFNVARPTENYRIRELAQIVRETVPGCTIEFAGDASPDTRNYRVNASKIASILPEFTPVWTARQGAEQLYEAFKEVGITLDEFEVGSTGASARSSSSWRADGWVPICVGRDDEHRADRAASCSLTCLRCPATLLRRSRPSRTLTVVAGRGAAGTCQPRPA